MLEETISRQRRSVTILLIYLFSILPMCTRSYPQHVLQPYLEQRSQLRYNLRNRPGINKSLFDKTMDLNVTDFSVRNLYKTASKPIATFT